MSNSRIELFQKVIYEGPTDNESFDSFRLLCSAGIADQIEYHLITKVSHHITD